MKRFLRQQILLLGASSVALLSACERFDDEGVWIRQDCESGQTVELLRPFEGSQDAYVGSWIVGEVECEAPELALSVTRRGGQEVLGELTSHRQQRQLRLRPTDYLAPNSDYTARMETDDGNREWSFTTSATGTAVGGAVGGVAAAGLGADATVLEPAGAARLLRPELASWKPALQLLSDVTGDTLTARLGAWTGEVDDGVQDGARSTRDLTLTWEDPHFRSVPTDLRIRLDDVTLALEDATVGAAVEPGAGGLQGLWIDARWDTREAAAALGDLCQADVDGWGPGCIPCRDGEASCLAFLVVHVPQTAWPGSLVEVSR